jgi:hypothetical protein
MFFYKRLFGPLIILVDKRIVIKFDPKGSFILNII